MYNKLYLNTEVAIKNVNGSIKLRDIADVKSGDEVGSDNYIEFLERNDDDYAFIRTSDFVNYEADLYPDFYISKEIVYELKQDILPGDVIFTKDGKIGCTGMLTHEDNLLLASGVVRIRLKPEAVLQGFTQEYLFLALSIKEVGYYGAIRRTVIASTIPHLREERLKDIELPIIDKDSMENITTLVKNAFLYKAQRKSVLRLSDKLMYDYFKVND